MDLGRFRLHDDDNSPLSLRQSPNRRAVEYSSMPWDDVVTNLKDNRDAYPWEERVSKAVFRGKNGFPFL